MAGIRASNTAALSGWGLRLGALGLAFTILPTGVVEAKKKKDDAAAESAATTQVVVTEKTELKADPSDNGKVLKKLKGKDKLEFVERSPDGKWAKVKKGKAEGWVQASALEGLPAAPAKQEPAKQEPVKVEALPEKKPDPVPTQPPPVTTTPAVTAPATTAQKPPVTTTTVVEPPATPPPVTPPPVVAAKQEEPIPPPKAERLPLTGFWLSIGGGASLLGSKISATTSSGLTPELFNYHIDNQPALGLQLRLGYTFGYKAFRVGVDAGYRFAGATSIVVNLPNRDPYPVNGGSTAPLVTPRQEISTTAHDADAALSIGGNISLPKRLDLSLRVRGGFQFFGFVPEINTVTPLPQEIFYGPHVGGIAEFQSRFVPGFGVRVEGGYIPYAVRSQNSGLRDGQQDKSTGYFVGGSLGVRIIRGFDVEVAYRMLSTTTTLLQGSDPERLRYDRDMNIRSLYTAGEKLDSGERSTAQQTITLNLVFLRN